MQIDPVIAIAEELRRVEAAIMSPEARRDVACCRQLLAEISMLNERLFTTVPTSALGAAELLSQASLLLADSCHSLSVRLHRIGTDFACGKRTLQDLVWLRVTGQKLASGVYGEDAVGVTPLLLAAVCGASRPVLVSRRIL